MKDYILYEITQKIGKLNASTIYTLQWLDVDTLEQYEMTVDSTYRNYTYWTDIIFGEWMGVYTGVKRRPVKTNKGKLVLDADSKAQKIEDLTVDDIIKYVEYKRKPKQTAFESLFTQGE